MFSTALMSCGTRCCISAFTVFSLRRYRFTVARWGQSKSGACRRMRLLRAMIKLCLKTSHGARALEALATEAAIAMEDAALFDDLQRSNVELILAYDKTLEGWVKALDLRDHETEGHTLRVTEMTLRLARAMNISDLELMHIRRGALLHDIGKIGVPDAILSKPGPLTEEEHEIMRLHPTHAYEMLSPIAFLRPALDIPYCHHERWDGTGYPRGLRGEHVPPAARIFAVADVWDALSSDRPYHAAWAPDKVREYVRTQSESHFDPDVVRIIMEIGMDSPLRRGDMGR